MSQPKITDYDLFERLGKGSYASVYRAMSKATKEVFAIKIIARTSVSVSNNVVLEIGLLQKLKHKHIVELCDFFFDDKNVYIVMEYCNQGTLSMFIRKQKTLPEKTCHTFLQQLALALQHMRRNDVSHLDLKPANLLLSKQGCTTILKVGDFGLAQRLKLNQENSLVKGSLLYMAPEILLSKSYGPNVDLWSVGVILYECLFGTPPFTSATTDELMRRIRSDSITIPPRPEISDGCRNLLTQLLQRNPSERISFKKFFEHPFLDLEHAPSAENLEKAMHLIKNATALAEAMDLQAAYHGYYQGLRYLVPIAQREPNPIKKGVLQLQTDTYLKRAEELKQAICGKNPPCTSTQKAPYDNQAGVAASSSNVNTTYKFTVSPHQFIKREEFEAFTLGLEFGYKADVNALQNKLNEAFEGYTAALEILIPMLQKEIPESVKKHLRMQVAHWMEKAEHIKSIRSAPPLATENTSGDVCKMQ